MATTFEDVDSAWFDFFNCHYVGDEIFSQNILINAAEVPVYIGQWPFTESAQVRPFPAISINLSHFAPDIQRLESYVGVVVSEDLGSPTPTRVIAPDPEPYILSFTIHTWARTILEDRQLVTGILANILINDTLTIDNGDNDAYMIRDSIPTSLDEVNGDQVTYHKAIGVDVYIEIDINRETTVPVVTEGHVNFMDRSENFDTRLVFTDVDDHIESTEL
jgi:hypothetical protein